MKNKLSSCAVLRAATEIARRPENVDGSFLYNESKTTGVCTDGLT